LAEAQNIIERLQTLRGIYEPELYRILIKELVPEYKSVAGNSKIINFNTGKILSNYNFQN
jgi:hypothetical protein